MGKMMELIVRKYHEAGHAVVGMCLGHDLNYIQVDPPNYAPRIDAAVFSPVEAATIPELLDLMTRFMAGRAAVRAAMERNMLPAETDPDVGYVGTEPDADQAKVLGCMARAQALGGDAVKLELLAEAKARQIVDEKWDLIGVIVNALSQRPSLSDFDIRDLDNGLELL